MRFEDDLVPLLKYPVFKKKTQKICFSIGLYSIFILAISNHLGFIMLWQMSRTHQVFFKNETKIKRLRGSLQFHSLSK